MNIVVISGSSAAFKLGPDLLEIAKSTNWKWCIQSVALGSKNVSENIRTEEFIDVQSALRKCDVLISHCGAGTVFWALEKKLKFITIVDEDRHDDHQWDLGNYLEHNDLCLVLRGRAPTISEITDVFENRKFSEYTKMGLKNLKSELSDFEASDVFNANY